MVIFQFEVKEYLRKAFPKDDFKYHEEGTSKRHAKEWIKNRSTLAFKHNSQHNLIIQP